MDATGTHGRIEMRLEETETLARVAVIDDGPGIGDTDADRIFQAFVTTKPEGIGLGLTAARRTAEAHGGSLSYRRDEGKTVFEILLPKSCQHQRQLEACCP
jgi:signal transduction histidine kinase